MAKPAEISARVLVVEDDEGISEAIAFKLRQQSYTCLTAADGLEGLRLLRREKPDLMVLDLMLPGMDGWKLCQQAREEGFDLPIIIVSARTSEFDKVQALSMGADDYLTKPFGMNELAARVEAHLRRAQRPGATPGVTAGTTVEAGPLTIDPGRKEAFADGEPLGLTSKEYAVLYLVASQAPMVLSREDIYRSVWGYEMLHGDRSVDVFVRRIRKKLIEKIPTISFLHTHYGFGYKFEMRED
ncbi:MAG: response regulator transcription factor [Thermoleophilia bacterium]|nr:response regulator transcription factor [Thermoleophilia bacterium]